MNETLKTTKTITKISYFWLIRLLFFLTKKVNSTQQNYATSSKTKNETKFKMRKVLGSVYNEFKLND